MRGSQRRRKKLSFDVNSSNLKFCASDASERGIMRRNSIIVWWGASTKTHIGGVLFSTQQFRH